LNLNSLRGEILREKKNYERSYLHVPRPVRFRAGANTYLRGWAPQGSNGWTNLGTGYQVKEEQLLLIAGKK